MDRRLRKIIVDEHGVCHAAWMRSTSSYFTSGYVKLCARFVGPTENDKAQWDSTQSVTCFACLSNNG